MFNRSHMYTYLIEVLLGILIKLIDGGVLRKFALMLLEIERSNKLGFINLTVKSIFGSNFSINRNTVYM